MFRNLPESYKLNSLGDQVNAYIIAGHQVGEGVYVTLLVGGVVLSGTLVSGSNYKNADVNMQTDSVVPPFIDFEEDIPTTTVRHGLQDKPQRQIIYLREVTLYLPGGGRAHFPWFEVAKDSIDGLAPRPCEPETKEGDG